MQTQPITQQQYKTLLRNQANITKEVNALKSKAERTDLLKEFRALSRWGRAFAKAKGIKPADVLKDD